MKADLTGIQKRFDCFIEEAIISSKGIMEKIVQEIAPANKHIQYH